MSIYQVGKDGPITYRTQGRLWTEKEASGALNQKVSTEGCCACRTKEEGATSTPHWGKFQGAHEDNEMDIAACEEPERCKDRRI